MATRTSEEQLEAIVRIIAQHPEGIGRAALEEAYERRHGRAIGSRTLQRRLARLLDARRIQSEGAGPAVTYRTATKYQVQDVHFRVTESQEGYVKVSPDGADVRALVRRPLAARTPVGYHPELLLDYEPGVTWYLSQEDRASLHDIGRTPIGEQPAGTYARAILDRLLIDLSWASSRLEGNTYSRLDTVGLIEFGQRAEGKDAAEAQMILNHKHAIELLVDQADEIGFNAYTFRNLHAALAENLLSDPGDEGRLRKKSVLIAGSVYTPLAIPQQIEEYFHLLLQKADRIPDPFEQAFFVMVHVPYLQPFADVNKRVSRLGANVPLIKHNLCPLSFVDVPVGAYIEALLGMYEMNRFELLRDVFLWAYKRSSRQYKVIRESLREPDTFRLRYRNKLADLLGAIIQARVPPRESTVREYAVGAVPEEDLDRFVELALGELLNLHEGNIARYGLRPARFRSWRDDWRPPS